MIKHFFLQFISNIISTRLGENRHQCGNYSRLPIPISKLVTVVLPGIKLAPSFLISSEDAYMIGWGKRLLLATAIIGLTALAGGVNAHHSYVSKYDASRQITLKGVITAVEYFNPHIFFTIRLAGPKGAGMEWEIETEGIPKAQAKGLTRNRLAVGTRVTVTGWPARSGARKLGMSSLRLPGGRTISMRTRPR